MPPSEEQKKVLLPMMLRQLKENRQEEFPEIYREFRLDYCNEPPIF